MITELKEKEIFVFGSNEAGVHGAGAARQACKEFGAIYGIGFGHIGSTFAIPTKDWDIETLPLSAIKHYVNRFVAYAKSNQAFTFLVTEIGCGLAGYEAKDIAPLFDQALKVPNIKLPDNFKKYLLPEMVKETFIDPPSGWKYGFPKVLPDDVDNVEDWLIKNGYPEKFVNKDLTYRMFSIEYPKNAKSFNKYWKDYLCASFYGCVVDEQDVLKYLHHKFLGYQTEYESFKFEQIKYKSGRIVAYVTGVTVTEWQNLNKELNEILEAKIKKG